MSPVFDYNYTEIVTHVIGGYHFMIWTYPGPIFLSDINCMSDRVVEQVNDIVAKQEARCRMEDGGDHPSRHPSQQTSDVYLFEIA